jgi:NTP pyrophosphatase (non-canonical NTP hydrolase)
MPSIPEEADLRIHTERLRAFARAREWEQFHTPKNLAMAIAVEAAELMEPLLWLTPDEAGALKDDAEARAKVGSEIADVAIYLIRLADVLGIDLGRAIARKIDRNEERFPVEVVLGKSRMPGVAGDG